MKSSDRRRSEELQIARTMVNASTADFNLEKYSDLYTRKLELLIEANGGPGATFYILVKLLDSRLNARRLAKPVSG